MLELTTFLVGIILLLDTGRLTSMAQRNNIPSRPDSLRPNLPLVNIFGRPGPCQIIPDTSAVCPVSIGAQPCNNHTFLAGLLMEGQSLVTVCTFRYRAPIVMNVVAELDTKVCPEYMGSTAVCFLPLNNEKRNCEALTKDQSYSRVQCTSEAAITSFLPQKLVTICLLNPSTNVFEDQEVSIDVHIELPGFDLASSLPFFKSN